MSSGRRDVELEKQLREAGVRLLIPPSSIDKLIGLLDKVERLLANVNQAPLISMRDALKPSMKALIADELLRHRDNDVRVSVASCISEITRISAPNRPYDDELMKEIFQLFVATFENLSHVSGRCYTKALSILETIANVRSCLIMLELECDTLIIEMFQHFLKINGPNHPYAVFEAMETIMILVIDESEDVSWDLISTLLASVRKENQAVSLISWKLAETVITNCAAKLKPYLMEAVHSGRIALDEYAEIVVFICKGEYETLQHDHLNGTEEHMASESPELGKQLVGRRIKVWWPGDGIFYKGIIDSYDHIRRMHMILYDDGDQETLNLKHKLWELIGDGVSPGGGQETGVFKPDAQSDIVRDGNFLRKSPKAEIKRKHPVAKEVMMSKAEAKSSDRDENCLKENRKTEVNWKHPVAKEVMMSKASAKSSDRDENCSVQTPNTEVIRKLPVETEVHMTSKPAAKSLSSDGKCSEESLNTRIKRKHTAAKEIASETAELGEQLVGSRIKVWWPGDDIDGNFLRKSPKAEIQKKHPVAKEVMMSKAAAKSSDRDENCLKENRKTEVNWKHPVAKEVMMSKASAKSSDRDENRSVQTPNTVVIRKLPVETEVNMMSKPAAKSLSIDGNCSEETLKTGVKWKHTAGKEIASETPELGEQLVGSRIKVWWPVDRIFYKGTIDSYDHIRRMHMILYDDGDQETLNLKHECWDLIGDGVFPRGGQETDVSKLNAPSDILRKKKRKTEFEAAKEGKAHSSSKRSKSSASASKLNSRKSGGNCNGTTPDKPIVVDESMDKADTDSKQITKETMTPKVAASLPVMANL